MIQREQIDLLNQKFECFNPAEILDWTARLRSERVVATSSFQAQSVPLLYFISKICPRIPVLFLDTGFHFSETLQYVESLRAKLELNVKTLHPLDDQVNGALYTENPDMCCYLRKVEPLKRELKNYDIWLSGIRRDQTTHRHNLKIVSLDSGNDVIKICPMANVSNKILKEMNGALIARMNVPENPLYAKGYTSVGCWPCTQKPVGEDERSGRWSASEKTECGLHLPEEYYTKKISKKRER